MKSECEASRCGVLVKMAPNRSIRAPLVFPGMPGQWRFAPARTPRGERGDILSYLNRGSATRSRILLLALFALARRACDAGSRRRGQEEEEEGPEGHRDDPEPLPRSRSRPGDQRRTASAARSMPRARSSIRSTRRTSRAVEAARQGDRQGQSRPRRTPGSGAVAGAGTSDFRPRTPPMSATTSWRYCSPH